ncbi:MAG: hypothetical protein F6K50_36605, partial [Moorea sp. SIO3I7]|nr:hypothetical protein [Moorena sp. SIO3I7]
MNAYAKYFGCVVWLGIIINVVFFVIPLLFFPEVMLSLLKMQIPVPIIWVRAAGLLLLEISILYIPGAMDPYRCLDAVAHGGNHGSRSWGRPPRPRCLPKTALHRYKATAWMSILVTRGGGATFFITAVLLFGQDLGFMS